MKLISWNVNGIRACITKGFEDRFKESWMQIFSACRRRNASRDRLSWSFRGITSTGIMRTAEGIPAQPYLQRKSHCR